MTMSLKMLADIATHAQAMADEAQAMAAAITASNELYYRVLFLQADALMNMASLPEYEERRDELYNEVEVILLDVRKAVGTTYETCLERLAELYQKTDNIEKHDEVIKILSAIRGL